MLALTGSRGHKSLVFFSEGFVLSPSVPQYDRVVEAALRARVDMGAAVRQALAEACTYYLLGYEPAGGRDGFREVQVRVHGKNLRVLGEKRRYSFRIQEDPTTTEQRLNAVFDESGLALKVHTSPGTDGSNGTPQTLLRIEVDLPDGLLWDRQLLRMSVEARAATGGIFRADAEASFDIKGLPRVVMRKPLALAPGVWQVRVVVEDPETGAVGSALHAFTVRPTRAPRGEEG
jgi:hypothetical protein